MKRTTCQLLQQSEAGWVVSLGEGVPSRNGSRASKARPRLNGSVVQSPVATLEEPTRAAPQIAEAADCKVFFDGVLYNRAELNGRFANSSPAVNDADLVLRAYLHWGEDVLSNIKGIFAVLIWDGRRGSLLCARDPLGVYPLFYAETRRGEMLFSTSIEVLIQHPDVSDFVNRAALADYLRHRTPVPEETFFEAVKRVPASRAMRVKGKDRKEYRYWDPVPNLAEMNWVTEDELGQFDELLDQAVNRCLQFGRAGIFLSGGLDSVSVAAVATDNSRRMGLPDPLALSLIFPGDANEETVQRRVGSELGLQHELVPFGEAAGPQGLLSAAAQMSSGMSTPLINPWTPAYETLLLEGKRQGCRTILSGGGGDEWLTVGPMYAADLVGALDVKGLYRLSKSMRRAFGYSYLSVVRSLLWTCGVRPWMSLAGRRVIDRVNPEILRRRRRRQAAESTPEWVAPDPALRQEIDQRAEDRFAETLEAQSFYFSQWQFDHPLVAMQMEEDFESFRRTGVRQLMPYWDADLVDFLYRTPPEFLNRGERSKAMVRQTVARRFPHLNFERQKKVFGFNFFTSLVLGEGPRLWQDMEGAPALTELGVVDAPALNSAVTELLSGTQPWWEAQRVRDIVFLEAWARQRLGQPLHSAAEGEKSLIP